MRHSRVFICSRQYRNIKKEAAKNATSIPILANLIAVWTLFFGIEPTPFDFSMVPVDIIKPPPQTKGGGHLENVHIYSIAQKNEKKIDIFGFELDILERKLDIS